MDRFGTFSDGFTGKNPLINRNDLVEQGVYEDPSPLEPPTTDTTDLDVETMVYLDAFRKLWDIEDLRFTPFKNRMLAAWSLYHNTYEVSQDADQTDKRYPTALMFVERWASQLMRMIDTTPNWFRPIALVPSQQVLYNLVKRLMTCVTSRRDGNNQEFWACVEEAFKSGVMTGQMIAQIVPKEDEVELPLAQLEKENEKWLNSLSLLNTFTTPDKDTKKPFVPNPLIPKLSLRILPAENFLLDSSGCNRYRMWTQVVPVAQVFAEASKRGYDTEALRRAKKTRPSSVADVNKYTQQAREGMGVDTNPPEGMMRLHFFEGSLPDPTTGALLFENKFMVMANGVEIILEPTEPPFWDACPSTVTGKFISPPHSVYGKGLLSENVDGVEVKGKLINQLFDWIKMVLNPPFEEDQDLLEETEKRNPRGMFPGRIIKTESTNGQSVYKAVTPGDMPPSFWNGLQYIDAYAQTADGSVGSLSGATPRRLRTTDGEDKRRAADSGTLAWGIFQNLERFLAEVLRIYFLRVLQYTPDKVWKDWVMIESMALIPPNVQDPIKQQWTNLFEIVSNWSAEERYKKMGGFYSFSIDVFSNLGDRQDTIEKIVFMLRSLSQVPGAIQTMRMPFMVRKLVEAYGWDPEEALNLDQIPAPDPNVLNPNPGDSSGESYLDSAPDLSGGGMDLQFSPVSEEGGVFPGGPRNSVANSVSPLVQ